MEALATSKDGTPIGYVQTGDGPGLVLVHGALQTSRNFERLASALARSYRVVRYDRRGRGQNAVGGSDGAPDRFMRETDDLVTVIEATAATYVFGLSSGAILTMGAALEIATVDRVVLYEPPLAMQRVDPGDWADDFLRALAHRRFGAAMAFNMKGTGDREPLTYVPRSVLSLLFDLAVRTNAAAPNGTPLRELLLTVPADIAVQREASKSLPPLSRFTTPTLLLGGSRSCRKLTRVLDGLERELPNARRALIRGAGHLAADNDGRPEDVARAIDSFLRAKIHTEAARN